MGKIQMASTIFEGAEVAGANRNYQKFDWEYVDIGAEAKEQGKIDNSLLITDVPDNSIAVDVQADVSRNNSQ